MKSDQQTSSVYQKLFHPRSIVVIGASNNISKPGGRIIKNIIENGYQGKLRAINPSGSSVMDLPTYKSVDELPLVPDIAIIAIPAHLVVGVMEELESKGVSAVIVLSAGFSELNEKGRAMEQKLKEIANRSNMTLVGPNCLGIMTPSYVGKFAGIVPKLREGSVDFITCSGATADQLMEQATLRGLALSSVITTGNSAQTGVEDILELIDENFGPKSSPILMLYMESVKKPSKLLRHARSLNYKGCILLGIKSGVTSAGKRAASSHTGAIATNDTAVDALFEKAGLIRVQSKVELIDVASVLYAFRGNIKGNRVCIITDAGGPGVMLSDELNRQGLELPVLKKETQQRLSDLLPPQSPIGNPIDCLPTRNGEQIKAILDILEDGEKDNIDAIVIITSNSMLRDNWDTYEAIINWMDNESSIPVIPVLSPGTTGVELIERFKSYGKLYFPDEVPIGRALGKIVGRSNVYELDTVLDHYDKKSVTKALKGQNGHLSSETANSVLKAAGFNVPKQQEIFKKDQLKSSCEQVGFPLVMKVIGLLHKSDSGGVKVGINSLQEAAETWEELYRIDGAKGVVAQQMIQGHEVILGASRENEFGHLIMFGMGGIYTEIFEDVRFGLAPLVKEECVNMIKRVKAYEIIKGARGEQGMSVEILADYLARLSQLVTDFPEISEIDLNPLKGYENEIYAVDTRIIVD